jgi:hypothetical protein
MNLRDQILKEHTKANCDLILQWVGNSQKRFDELFDLFLHDDYRVVQRAAWPLSYAVIAKPALIKKHFKALIQNLHQPGLHPAVKRNTMRLLQDIDLPERYQGEIMDTCFSYIADPVEAPAVKAFSLTVLEKLSHTYPEIKSELKTIINDRWEFETAAFHSRARKILQRIG